MSVAVTMKMILTIVETVTPTNIPFAAGASQVTNHNGLDETITLNAASTPPASKSASFQKAMTAGAATIDLTAMVGTNGVTVDGTALKVCGFKFRNPVTNANAIVITFGASNAYLLLGTGFKITLNPGESQENYKFTTGVTIDATHKNIDISGTGSQALDCEIVMG